MKQKIFFLLAMLFCITLQTMAQTDDDKPENKEVDMDAPTFEPMVKVGQELPIVKEVRKNIIETGDLITGNDFYP